MKRKIYLLGIGILITLLSCQAPKKESGNKGIPKWLAESETYGENVKLEDIYGTNWSFITHVPHTKEFLQEAKSRGIRAFPYMTFYQGWLFDKYENIRLADHTDWIQINEKGEWAKTGFWESEDSKNMYCTCTNVKGYADAVLEYLELLLKRGASGIFLDNLHPNKKCYGEEFGIHKHMFKTQIEAFADLLRRAHELIKKYDPDGALLVNSADPATLPKEFWPYVDAEMSESYIVTWVAENRWGDWHKDWNGIDKKIPAGKQVCCLSYPGHDKQYTVKEDAFFCYSSARLMNFIWSAGYNKKTVKDDSAIRKLYGLRLGQPVTEEKIVDEIHYRIFKDGLVVVNPTDDSKKLTIKNEIRLPLLWDVFNDDILELKDGSITLDIPAQSGRVYVMKPSLDNGIDRGKYKLTVETEPGLGKTQFKLDGLPMVTYAGRWTTKYVKGPNYGKFYARFDKPGYHEITIVDTTRAEILVANSYEDAYKLNDTKMMGAVSGEKKDRDPNRLGKLMDPSEPGKTYSGKPYKFVGWAGPVKSNEKTVKVYVDKETVVIAKFKRMK